MPTRRIRSRIAAIKNAARAVAGLPPLRPTHRVSAMFSMPWESLAGVERTVSMPLESEQAQPITLGPVTVRTSASIAMKVIRADGTAEDVDPHVGTRLELAVPDTRTAELSFLFMTTTGGATFAQLFVPGQESGLLGAVIGLAWGFRKWKRLHGH